MNSINVFDFANEQRDDELFFKVSVYDVIINVKNVIENEFLNVMIVDLIRIRVINEKI